MESSAFFVNRQPPTLVPKGCIFFSSSTILQDESCTVAKGDMWTLKLLPYTSSYTGHRKEAKRRQELCGGGEFGNELVRSRNNAATNDLYVLPAVPKPGNLKIKRDDITRGIWALRLKEVSFNFKLKKLKETVLHILYKVFESRHCRMLPKLLMTQFIYRFHK